MFIKTKIFFILILILSFFVKPKVVFGVSYFSESFNQGNLDNWLLIDINAGQKSWKITDNKLVGEVVNGEFSFLVAKSFWNLSDYSIRVDTVNKSGIDQDIAFRVSEDGNNYYMLNIRFKDQFWPQDNKGEIVLWKCSVSNCGRHKRLIDFTDLTKIKLTQEEVHKIKIEVNGVNIKIYFDSVLIINFDDTDNPYLFGSFGFYNWGGSYDKRSTLNLFDNLVVGDFNYEEPVVKIPKIIIIPGFGASWNSEAIVYNNSVNNDKWRMTPFVKSYNGLIDALNQNGLNENEDFYVWNYDWRKPLNKIVDNLNSFINQKVNSDEKVVLIGHSLGGLTSRIWAEDNRNDSRLERVITLGSPHLGSVDSYEVWNGGQISDLHKSSSIAFKILLKIQGLTTKTDMEAARKYVPLIKDLLPTFNFISKNGANLNNDQLETSNTFLQNKNNEGLNSGINLKLFAGKNYETIDSVELKNNNIFDKVLGIWPDGRINKFLYTNDGDNTVLIKSANYNKSDFVELNSNHGEIMNKTINQVMTEIGLSQVEIINENEDLKNNLVFFVGSPVSYSVKCDDDSPVLENDGFVVIKNNNYNTCVINLVGTGNGLIHVVIGNTNDNNWSYWEKNIVNGEIINIKINPKNGEIINDNNNILFLKSIIRENLNSLLLLNKNNNDLKEALKNLDKNQPKQLIKNIFDFRKTKTERVITKKIIDNATIWISLIDKCSKKEAVDGFKKVDIYQNLIDKLVNLKNKKNFKIDENAAISYQKMDEILKINEIKINKKDYFGVCANNFTALNYGNEVLLRSRGDDAKKWLLEDSDL